MGSYQVTNTVIIPANGPPSYCLIPRADDQNAVFGANETDNWRAFGVGLYCDADNDRIPDWREEQCFGSIANCAPDADPDGDRMPNLFEYVADTNPTNALSVLRSSRILAGANALRIDWQRGVQAWQFVERSDALAAPGVPWAVICTNSPPTPLQTNLLDLLSTNQTLF